MISFKRILSEGMDYINSLMLGLPSHNTLQRKYLPPEIQATMAPEPQRAAPRAQPAPAARAAAPAAQQGAPGQNYGDPGMGSKKIRFNAMYAACNGTGMSRNQFKEIAMARLEMTQMGANTYLANAAHLYGPWRLA